MLILLLCMISPHVNMLFYEKTYPAAVKSAKDIFLNESFWTDCAVNLGALLRGLKPLEVK
jgi:hypothetical protein